MISSLIDTIRFHLAINHQTWIQAQSALHSAGTINPITKACASHYRRFSVPGEYGSKATVWSLKNGTELAIECSAPRFLTGQNVFGSENLSGQVLKIAIRVCKHLGIKPIADEKQAVSAGLVRTTRVDLTTHIKLDSDAQVEHFLKAIKLQLAFGHHYFSAYGNETLYINQHSDSKSLKLYNKGRELQAHPLNRDLANASYIEGASDGLLRVELTLRRRFLERQGMSEVRGWDPMCARQLLIDEVDALKLRNVQLKEYRQQPGLSAHANTLLAAHMAGVDVETIVPSARSLKVHARAIVEATGINIYVPFVAQAAGSKVDLEGLGQRLEFGTDRRATALGITENLPRLPAAEPPMIVVPPRPPGARAKKMRKFPVRQIKSLSHMDVGRVQ